MRKLLGVLATATLCAISSAQSPLTTTFANNNAGAVGGGVYFDLNATIPIQVIGMDLNLNDAAGTAGTIELYAIPGGTRTGNQINQAAWTLVGTANVVAAGPGLPTSLGVLSIPITGMGGCACKAIGVSHAYTNGNGTNQTVSTVELTLTAGEASNVAFAGGLFTPRVVNCNIYYVLGGSGTVATRSNYGTGCYQCFASTYENFTAAAAFDLNGTYYTFTPAAGGYVITPGGGPYTPPSGAATVLALSDDSEVTVVGATGTYTVCSNGYISAATGNGTGFTPAVATMLNAPQTAWWVWHDYNPATAGSGQVKHEVIGGVDYFTWDGVWDFGGTSAANANTFQICIFPNGVVVCCFLQMSGLGNGILVAYSPGGSNLDPGNTDISAAMGAQILCATDQLAISHNASARPVAGTTIALNSTNAPLNVAVGAELYGLVQQPAGIDLGAFGAGGCRRYVDILTSQLLLFAAGNASINYGIPAGTTFNGVMIFTQSAGLSAGANPLGLVTSNGTKLTIGNL